MAAISEIDHVSLFSYQHVLCSTNSYYTITVMAEVFHWSLQFKFVALLLFTMLELKTFLHTLKSVVYHLLNHFRHKATQW